jgi:hypothetical protein
MVVPKRFIDYLKANPEFECDLIIDSSVNLPAVTFTWCAASARITEDGYQKFRSLLDAEFEVLVNGKIDIGCSDADLVEYFVLAYAGYADKETFRLWFKGPWCKTPWSKRPLKGGGK